MKKSLFAACFCLVALLATNQQSQACSPCPVRPVPNVVRPAPVLPNPVPVPPNQGGQTNVRPGDQVVWDLPAEEKARIRAAAKATGKLRTNSNIRR